MILGYLSLFSVLVKVGALLMPGVPHRWILWKLWVNLLVLLTAISLIVSSHLWVFLAGFVMLVLSIMPECGPRLKLAAGLGEPWTRDGGILQGCPLSMMFMVALYLPWCHGLAEREGVVPQLYAENLKCASRDSGDHLAAAQFTSRYIRLVGQDAAPSKCVLLSTLL